MRTSKFDKYYLSAKGVKYICNPKRGMCTDINPEICQTITAKGQHNWTGSFVSNDIARFEKSQTIGSKNPTIIHLMDGRTITSDDDLSPYSARMLTPRECGRLMDFLDQDITKVIELNSDAQAYHQFGNSIVRNVLVAIMGQMLPGKEEVYKGERNEQIS